MERIWTNWYLASEEVENDAVVQSAQAAEQLINPDYDHTRQLSDQNLAGVRELNGLLVSYNQLGADQAATLTQEQLVNAENLLAGAAGEWLVDQAVKSVAAAVFHNVILPCKYDRNRPVGDNQIDNLVITSTGIYCIEVKVRKIAGKLFDFNRLGRGIYDQISYHKEALTQVLQPMGISPNFIKTIVVVINRLGNDDFKLKNQEDLQRAGSQVVKLSVLNLFLSNDGFALLNQQQIQAIEQAIQSQRLPDRRTYSANVRFKLTQAHLDKARQISQAVRLGIPLAQNVTYHERLNDYPLTGLTGKQQNMLWLIVGRLYGFGCGTLQLTRSELRTGAGYGGRDFLRLDQQLSELAEFMQQSKLFQKAKYEDKKLTVSVSKKYSFLFNGCTKDFTCWNYQLLRRISLNNAKTLFRKLLQASAAGCYQVSFEQLREILAVPDSYSNYKMIKRRVERAWLQLVPFFGNLNYDVSERGRANKIIQIRFTFNKFTSEELMIRKNYNYYLNNILANPYLSAEEKEQAQKLFEKDFKDYLNHP